MAKLFDQILRGAVPSAASRIIVSTAAGVAGWASALPAGFVDSDAIATGSVTSDKLAAAEAWHYVGDTGQPAFLNGWENAGSPFVAARFRKLIIGYVYLQFAVRGGAVGSAMWNMPSGPVDYRPDANIQHPCGHFNGSVHDTGILNIDKDTGAVTVYELNNTRWMLGGLLYPTR